MMGVKTMSLLMALLLVSSSFAKPVQYPEPVKVEGGLLQGTAEDGLTITVAFLTQRRPSEICGGGLLSLRRNGKACARPESMVAHVCRRMRQYPIYRRHRRTVSFSMSGRLRSGRMSACL